MTHAQQPVVPLSPMAPQNPLPSTSTVRRLELFQTQPLVDLMVKMNERAARAQLTPLAAAFLPMEIHAPKGKPEAERFPCDIALSSGYQHGSYVLTGRFGLELRELPAGGETVTLTHTTLPVAKLPPDYWNQPCTCAQCKKPAQSGYVVYNMQEKRTRRLDESCLRGLVPPGADSWLAKSNHLLDVVAGVNKVVAEDRPFPGEHPFFNAAGILAQTAAIVRQHGYFSSAEARAAVASGRRDVTSTRNLLEAVLTDNTGESSAFYLPTKDDKDLAGHTLTWIRTDLAHLPDAEHTDYTRNLVAITRAEFFHARHLGIAISALPSFMQEMHLRKTRTKAPVAVAPVGISEGPGKAIGGLTQPRVPSPWPTPPEMLAAAPRPAVTAPGVDEPS